MNSMPRQFDVTERAARAQRSPDHPSESGIDGHRIFRELCWLSGLPLGASVVLYVAVRIAGSSAILTLSGVLATAGIAVGGTLMNVHVVRPALRLPGVRDLVATAVVALICAPTLLAGFWVLEQFGFVLDSSYPASYTLDGWPRWIGYADLVILTPMFEELLFRGLIQPKLGQLVGSTEALVVQAALFSAAHLSPVILATHFVMGLAFGWLRRRTQSLVPGILLHAAWNAWVVWSSS